MTSPREWPEWEALWRAERTPPAQLEEMIERTKRARRGLWLVRLLPPALAIVALAVVGAALGHAGNAFEVALGVVVAIGIVAVWIMDTANQWHSGHKLEAPAEEYLAIRRALCVRQLRFARLGWIVTALDLVFLVPWWIGGFAVHGAGFHVVQLLTLWGPLALMSGFMWWTMRLRRRARAELVRLADVSASA